MANIHLDSPTGIGVGNYRCPPAGTDTRSNDLTHGWVLEAIQEGSRYLESQRGYDDIDLSLNMIIGEDERISKSLSQVKLNLPKRDVEEIVATLANIRMLGEIKTDNRDFDRNSQILNKLHRAWYLNTFADRQLKKALQYAAVGARGYVELDWSRDFWAAGRGDLTLSAHGPRNVFPIQIGRDHDIQKAYAVIIKKEYGLMHACAKWPAYVDLFSPSLVRPGWFRKAMQKLKFKSPALNASEQDRHKEDDAGFPTVEIFDIYILDLSINEGPQPVQMGAPGTKWGYTVPYIGQDIPAGSYDPATGAQLYRKSTFEDCLLYPLRRRILATRLGIIDDNSSPWWHRKVPLVGFGLNEWPWDYLGYSLLRDVRAPYESLTRVLRAVDDSVNARLDPPIAIDETIMSQSTTERLSLRKPGQRIRANMQMGDLVKPIIPAEYYNIPPYVQQFWTVLMESIPNLMGTRDIQALAKAKQMPSGDTLERLMEMAGPRTADKSRGMEQSIRDLTDMWKGAALEFYDTRRIVTMLGVDGVSEEMFDYDPDDLIPSHTPAEFELIKQGKMSASTPSRIQRVDRAKHYIDSFYAHVTPYSLHQMTQIQNQMMMTQLWVRGFPIDPWTVAKALNIPNFGRPPAEYEDTVIGKWIAWLKLKNELMPPGPPQGRKPSGQHTPAAQSKDGGMRTTTRESPR